MLGHALSLLPLLALALAVVSVSAGKPPVSEKAETARWLAHLADWGTISTISVHLKGVPFGQGISFVDGTEDNSTGNFYFYTTEMDTSVQDTMVDPRVSFSTTMAGAGMCPTKKLDPEVKYATFLLSIHLLNSNTIHEASITLTLLLALIITRLSIYRIFVW
jgi:hypothetical protein